MSKLTIKKESASSQPVQHQWTNLSDHMDGVSQWFLLLCQRSHHGQRLIHDWQLALHFGDGEVEEAFGERQRRAGTHTIARLIKIHRKEPLLLF